MTLRRIITGHDAAGRSRIVIDGPPLEGTEPLLEVWSQGPGPSGEPGISSASPCSTATPSSRVSKPQRSSRQTFSATTTCSI